MKITSILYLMIAVLTPVVQASPAYSQGLNKRVTVSYRESTLQEVILDLQEKANIDFGFTEGLKLDEIKVTNVSFTKESLRNVLTALLHGQEIVFNESSGAIILSRRQQPGRITGIVTDENGEPLPGANVRVVELNRSVGANNDGRYSLSVPEGTYTLEARFISYKSEQKTGINVSTGGNLTVNFGLRAEAGDLEEVVVTALGIKREAKGLGYAVSTIGGKELTEARPNNWTDGLKGKVAGLNLTQTGSGPLNSTRINLRGDRSLDATKNEALIIVDGMPMVNSTGRASSGVSDAYGAGAGSDIPIDFGNGLGDINPDDIESISVLKGAAATALYGSRAANGALIITTKLGKKRGGIGVTINSNTSINDVLRWPDIQYEYGQGNNNRNAAGELYYSYGLSEDGANTGSTSSAFGPKFDGQMYYQYDPAIEAQSTERLPWVPYTNNIKGFWRTGMTLTNSVALDGATDNFSGRASITHTKNEWIMPNTGYESLVASLNTSAQLSDKLKLNAKVAFTNKTSDNLPGTGYNNQSIAYFMIFQNPNVDLEAVYGPRWKQGQEQVAQIHPYSSYIENPYLIAYEMTNGLKSNNIDGNLQGVYTFNPKWELMIRSGLNMRQDRRESRRPWNTANYAMGMYKQQDVFFFESNSDALLSYKDKIGEQFSINASLGGNLMNYQNKRNSATANGLTLPGVYTLANALDVPIANNLMENKKIHSVYGFVNLSWQDKIFVDVTGRNDWSSTLPAENRSYFYPSVSSSYILSDMIAMPSAVSFAKARLSWAMVGNDTDPYRLQKYYGQVDFPGSASAPTVLHNAHLKPEISQSWEAGLNFGLFNSRINADVNFYNNSTINQILAVPLDITTGYSSAYINAGKVRNRGIEVMLSGQPIANRNFSWTSTVTWAKNDNRVLELSEDINSERQIIAQTGGGVAQIIATAGGTTGDLWGYGLVRNEQGQVVFNASTGLAVRPSEVQKIGNVYADWRGGWQNEFSYKNWRLSALIDGQYGGLIYSQTHHKMTEQGKLAHTLLGRETMTVVGDGVVLNSDGSYSPNTTPVAIQTWYADYYRRANLETNTFDASYLKLREVRLEYSLPRTWLDRTKFSAASVALYGRDLFMISKFPIFDPETATLNGDTVMPGVEMGQLPTPRTWGLNLRLSL
ncbi:SusC/RagA family TonB-linked outer membrane protein [Olivibacter sitiensis]|uniref:SusC/RagA family TonB-linked outer membrane protein n=1 Tax=Olivibacter sitiensis TaxID=376470 RepID=UPI000562ACC6|nr:SusC/RagA family TonB-linked outer membrane protein [Olivibacter sitiensis]